MRKLLFVMVTMGMMLTQSANAFNFIGSEQKVVGTDVSAVPIWDKTIVEEGDTLSAGCATFLRSKGIASVSVNDCVVTVGKLNNLKTGRDFNIIVTGQEILMPSPENDAAVIKANLFNARAKRVFGTDVEGLKRELGVAKLESDVGAVVDRVVTLEESVNAQHGEIEVLKGTEASLNLFAWLTTAGFVLVALILWLLHRRVRSARKDQIELAQDVEHFANTAKTARETATTASAVAEAAITGLRIEKGEWGPAELKNLGPGDVAIWTVTNGPDRFEIKITADEGDTNGKLVQVHGVKSSKHQGAARQPIRISPEKVALSLTKAASEGRIVGIEPRLSLTS